MKPQSLDARRALELLSGDDTSHPSLPADAVARGRELLRAGDAVTEQDLQSLPGIIGEALLEAAVRERRVAVPERLAQASHKPLAKAAKKALYRLRSMGVESAPIAKPRSPAAVIQPSTEDEPLPGIASAVTGTGERALMVPRQVRGMVELTQWVISDELGITHFQTYEGSRGKLRRRLRELLGGSPPVMEVTLDEARAMLAEAHGAGLRAKTPLPKGAEDALRHLGVNAREDAPPLPVPEPQDERAAAQAHTLHDQPEMMPWLPSEPVLRVLAAKLDEVASSPLLLNEAQKQEQIRHAALQTAREYLTPERRHLYARRLWHMADFFERTNRTEPAAIARAEARRLFHVPDAPSAFVDRLFEKVLKLMSQARAGEQLPPTESSRTPASQAGLILP